MNSALRRQVEALHHAAQKGTFAQRQALLAGIDPELRREVEAMLAQGSDSASRIGSASVETGVGDSTLKMFGPGTRLGPYKLEGLIGAGGMGQVFRGLDTRLGRAVAIKISDKNFGERFDNEARLISALNHPHICTLYDVGPNYLVMELIDGSTLSDEIRKRPIAPEQAVRYGTQIAGALAEAHAQGIVHRDLKPSNIMLTRHGVKVLDFGLAKMLSETGMTQINAVLGTPAYMAPEQTEGREADARTDLFALGLVLYQMLAGKLPFPGASLGNMLAGGKEILIPPPCKMNTRIGSRLNSLILRLLEKDPAHRPQSALSVQQELIALTQHTQVKPAVMAALAAGLVLAAISLWWSYHQRPDAWRWGELSRVSMITQYSGNEATPDVSPDGTWVAFSWNGENGGHQNIYVTRVDGQEEPRQLTLDESEDAIDVFPAWSHDARQFAFVRKRGATGGEIIFIPAKGGPERKAKEIRFESLPAFSWLAWTPDDTQLAFASESLESGKSTLYLMRISDGKVRTLSSPPEGVSGDASPAFSPDGRSLAFVRWSSPTASTLLVQKLAADGERVGQPTTVAVAEASATSPVWADNQRLLFLTKGRILEWEAGLSPKQIFVSGADLAGLAIAERDIRKPSRLVVAQRDAVRHRLGMVPLRGPGEADGPATILSGFGNDISNPDISPDGKRVVFASQRSGTPELWTADVDGGNIKPLTNLGVMRLGIPRWSPDGRYVAFYARNPDEPQIYVIDSTQDHAAPQQVTHESPGCNVPSWSHDGKFLYCSRRIDGEMRLYRIPIENGKAVGSEMERLFEGKDARETSDGHLLYIKDDKWGLFSLSLAGDPRANPGERIIEDIIGPIAYYAPVTQGIYYTGQDALKNYVALRFFDYARRKTVDVASRATTGSVNSLTVSPDGKRLLYMENSKAGTDLALIEFKSGTE